MLMPGEDIRASSATASPADARYCGRPCRTREKDDRRLDRKPPANSTPTEAFARVLTAEPFEE
jgi:hypothetical protein